MSASTGPVPALRRLAILAAVAATSLLSACGGGSDKPDAAGNRDVATIVGASAAASAAAPTSAGERPLIRTDTSEQEWHRISAVWGKCLDEHGAKFYKNKEGSVKGAEPASLSQKQAAALAACANLEPEDVTERAERLDPLYKDKVRDWVKCMKSHHLKVTVNPDGKGFSYDTGLPSDDLFPFVDQCQDQVFGKG